MANTEITVRVDLVLLRSQRDAIIREVENNLELSGQDGTAEHVELLSGVIEMLDWMLARGEGFHYPEPANIVDLYANEGSD